MSAQMPWVLLGVGAGPSRTAWSGSSQEWHTIQIGPGSLTRRSSRWRSPQSSQVMVTRIAPAGSHPQRDGPPVQPSPAGHRPATERRHPSLHGPWIAEAGRLTLPVAGEGRTEGWERPPVLRKLLQQVKERSARQCEHAVTPTPAKPCSKRRTGGRSHPAITAASHLSATLPLIASGTDARARLSHSAVVRGPRPQVPEAAGRPVTR